MHTHTCTFTHFLWNSGQLREFYCITVNNKTKHSEILCLGSDTHTRTRWGHTERLVKHVWKVIRDPVFSSKVKAFSLRPQTVCGSFFFKLLYLLPLLLHLLFCRHSEPPEAHIDDEHYEKDATRCQLGVSGAGVQVLGVAPVLFRQAWQVAGLGVQRCGTIRRRRWGIARI